MRADRQHELVGLANQVDFPLVRKRQRDTQDELVTETLVEEVSIDGMCGVY